MIFIADAGSGTSEKSLYPLNSSVEYIDVEVVTGSSSFKDLVLTLLEVGDFEGAIVTEEMPLQNNSDYEILTGAFGEDKVRKSKYIPDYYQLRDRCKAVIQTGDYGLHAQAILVAGYPSADIPFNWLRDGLKK